MKIFYCYNSQGKADKYIKALLSAGFTQTQRVGDASVILTDYDLPARINQIKGRLINGEAKLFVYPHAAIPNIGWDGLFQKTSYPSGVFVSAAGHMEILRRIGIKKPIIVAGWAYSPIREFTPRPFQRVLFAPIHPNRNGFLSKLDREINKKTFTVLLSMLESEGIKLNVRVLRGIEENGLWKDKRVGYESADANVAQTWEKVLEPYDLIVSHQTLAYIAVALGKPTLMMGENIPPRNGNTEESFKHVSSWEKYRHLMIYPFDILNSDDPVSLARKACACDADILDWKSRMIGSEVFDEKKVIEAIQLY